MCVRCTPKEAAILRAAERELHIDDVMNRDPDRNDDLGECKTFLDATAKWGNKNGLEGTSVSGQERRPIDVSARSATSGEFCETVPTFNTSTNCTTVQ